MRDKNKRKEQKAQRLPGDQKLIDARNRVNAQRSVRKNEERRKAKAGDRKASAAYEKQKKASADCATRTRAARLAKRSEGNAVEIAAYEERKKAAAAGSEGCVRSGRSRRMPRSRRISRMGTRRKMKLGAARTRMGLATRRIRPYSRSALGGQYLYYCIVLWLQSKLTLSRVVPSRLYCTLVAFGTMSARWDEVEAECLCGIWKLGS